MKKKLTLGMAAVGIVLFLSAGGVRAVTELVRIVNDFQTGIKTDTIAEHSPAAGVTIDGSVLVKDGTVDRSTAAVLTIGPSKATSVVVTPAITLSGAVTGGQADITIPAVTDGGNAGAKNEFIGLPRIKLVGLGSGTNGAAAGKTLALMDDTPDGEWAAHDADTTVTASTTIYKLGAKSLGVLFTTDAEAGDGAHDGVSYDFSGDESVGLYMYCNGTWSSGNIVLDLTDDGGNHAIDFPAYATANTWQWVDLTTGITALANGDKDVITDISIELSAAGAAVAAGRATQCYFDAAYKWDSTEEEALGVAILRDGVLGVINAVTGASLVEGTDYFIHEESGNDFIVWITDQSAAVAFALVAY